MSFYNDHRVTCVDGKWWQSIDGMKAKTIELYFEEDGEDCSAEFEVPITFEVCPVCEGTGSHVNPSIDSHGLSGEDFAEDPDFAESYFRGDYDVPCNLCNGANVIPVCQDEQVRKYIDEHSEALAEMRAEYAAERRMGA